MDPFVNSFSESAHYVYSFNPMGSLFNTIIFEIDI